MIIAALLFVLGSPTVAANPPSRAAETPPAAVATAESARPESAPPLTSARTRAEVRAEAIEAARATRDAGER